MRCATAIAHLPIESCAPAAKRPRRKDAGSVRSRRLRARLRTRRGGALQRPCACGTGRSEPRSSDQALVLLDVERLQELLQRLVELRGRLVREVAALADLL